MKEELVLEISNILSEWNPLGESANSVEGLEGYKYEAMDILSTIQITKIPPEEAIAQVLTQAFKMTLNESELKIYSVKIEQLLNVH